MKKDFTRDYVTEMFRAYAAAGMPTYEEARSQIYGEELGKRAAMEPALAIAQAETATNKRTPYLLDILAVDQTMELLNQGGQGTIIRAVKAVYFVSPTKPLHRGDITDRVQQFSLDCPADARTVYHWLKKARLLCAALRGLRISDEDIKKYNIAL